MTMFFSARVALTAMTILTVGCAGSDDAAKGDTAAAATSDSGAAMAGMAGMPGMNRPAAKDADHEFLRNMIDHHEGFIQMAMAAMTKASQSTTQGEAHQMHTKQSDEQKKMIADVQSMYGETVTPMVMPMHKAMNDSLQAKSGAEYDRAFYRNVIAHHRDGIKMTDELLPRLAKPAVKQMAEKMKADQQKEIAAFERKMKP